MLRGAGGTRYHWRQAIVGLLIVAALSAVGCGDDGSSEAASPVPGETGSKAVAQGEPIQDCLIDLAVSTAIAPDNLAFFWKAKKQGDVVEIGSAYDEKEDVVVRLLTSKSGGTKEWMLWYSQPPSESRNIEELVRLRGGWYDLPPNDPKRAHVNYLYRNYVSFKLEPDASSRKQAERCVSFSPPGAETEETAKEKPELLPGQVSLNETVFYCLTEVGVQLAIAPGNIAFFREAKAKGDVVQVGREYDELDKVVVRLLASKREGTAGWMLWYSQPPPVSRDPESILSRPVGFNPNEMGFSPEKHAYVAFKVEPDRAFRKEIHRCVEFPASAG